MIKIDLCSAATAAGKARARWQKTDRSEGWSLQGEGWERYRCGSDLEQRDFGVNIYKQNPHLQVPKLSTGAAQRRTSAAGRSGPG